MKYLSVRTVNKGHQTQIDKYGGVEGYKAEMRRRRAMVKNLHPGFASMSKRKHKKISSKGGKGYAPNKIEEQDSTNSEEGAESQPETQETKSPDDN